VLAALAEHPSTIMATPDQTVRFLVLPRQPAVGAGLLMMDTSRLMVAMAGPVAAVCLVAALAALALLGKEMMAALTVVAGTAVAAVARVP
jgi:hypothetical protein